MRKDHNSNLVAIIVGFALIILIAGLAFFRLNKSQDVAKKASEAPKNAAAENIKKAAKISASDLVKKMLDRQSDLTLIDVRGADDFAKEHLLDSQNTPLPTIMDAMLPLDKDKNYTIINYDSSVEAIATIVKILTDAGFKNIAYLDGGFDGWKEGFNSTVSAGDPNSFIDQSKVTYIQTDKLKEMLEAGDYLTIIDVRKKNQFDEGHIKGAVNIFLEDLEKKRTEIPSNKKIVLYDNDGLWAFKAGVRLFDMGVFNTLTLSDGLDVWKSKNYELVK
ncbi:MAG: rhodanese-like domain-containing protein [Candidatus Moranbacteria bacterium]|nr:rhodanese-like domain-containing protein [Candidatus Moranbacteria bacterium]